MYYVYVLRLSNGQLYTGFTRDLKRRIQEHKTGRLISTRSRLPLELIHYEAYLRDSDARRREKFLKKSEGKKHLKRQIRDLLIELGQVDE